MRFRVEDLILFHIPTFCFQDQRIMAASQTNQKMSRASVPMAPKRGAQAGNNNARKSDEEFFMLYTWATCAKPAAESEEDLKELRVQHDKLRKAKNALKAGSRKDKAKELLRTIKAKINDAVQRTSSSGKKTGDAQRGRAAWHAIHAGLGLQYADFDDNLAVSMQAGVSEEESHVASPASGRDHWCESARIRDPPARRLSEIGWHAEVGEDQRNELGEETVKRTKKRQAFGLEMRASMNDEKKARRLACGVCNAATCDGLSCGPYEHQTAHHVCGICGNASCDGLSCNPYDFPMPVKLENVCEDVCV